MEVNINSKRLHRHALPVVMLVTGLFVLSATAINQLGKTEAAVARSLVTRVFEIQPTANGFTKLSPAKNDPKTLEINETGHSASLYFSMQ